MNTRQTTFLAARTLAGLCVTVLLAYSAVAEEGIPAEVGEPLPAWEEGWLEVHHINTGRGDAAFFILPDGTTMLFDAGDLPDGARPEGYIPPRRPDGSRPAGEWIGRYIRARHPGGEDAALDYAIMSHFHGDHTDGFADVAELLFVETLLDREGSVERASDEYGTFVDDYIERGMTMEKFEAGRDDQLVLRHDPGAFPDFKIRNLAVNAEAWTGTGHETRPRFAEGESIPSRENTFSTAFVMRYGPFAYFAGGDLQEPVEKAIAWVTGPVDVHVANHHGSQAHPFFLAALRPRVHIVEVWAVIQPRPHVFERLFDESIYPGPRDVFLTNGLWEGRAEHFLERHDERVADLIDGYTVEMGREYVEYYMPKTASSQGHVVVRVEPGGDRYHVAVLDDTAESFEVLSVHGPYTSRSAVPE